MKFLFSLFSLLLLIPCKGQNISLAGASLTDRLVGFYNAEKYDSIFQLFSPEMKAALPLDKAIDFFGELQKSAGDISKYEFKKTNQTYKQYKATFSGATFLLSISEDTKGKINGLYVSPYTEEEEKPVMARNLTKLSLPFSGEWFVFWGGDTKEQNYHISYKPQKNAFDIMIADPAGKTYRTDGLVNEDYYAFGQPILAPCDAKVVLAVDGVKDNKPGVMNPVYLTGNSVVLRTSSNEFLLFAHFKQHSVAVKEGQTVKKGQQLGLCGNSGNSSEPHLHFHIQDQENMTGATGIKCYFENLLVNGAPKTDYSPVKGERIKNAN